MGWFGRWLGGPWFGRWLGGSTPAEGPFAATIEEVDARTAELEDLDVSPYTAELSEIEVLVATLE